MNIHTCCSLCHASNLTNLSSNFFNCSSTTASISSTFSSGLNSSRSLLALLPGFFSSLCETLRLFTDSVRYSKSESDRSLEESLCRSACKTCLDVIKQNTLSLIYKSVTRCTIYFVSYLYIYKYSIYTKNRYIYRNWIKYCYVLHESTRQRQHFKMFFRYFVISIEKHLLRHLCE